jgi:hypothetical protein
MIRKKERFSCTSPEKKSLDSQERIFVVEIGGVKCLMAHVKIQSPPGISTNV